MLMVPNAVTGQSQGAPNASALPPANKWQIVYIQHGRQYSGGAVQKTFHRPVETSLVPVIGVLNFITRFMMGKISHHMHCYRITIESIEKITIILTIHDENAVEATEIEIVYASRSNRGNIDTVSPGRPDGTVIGTGA